MNQEYKLMKYALVPLIDLRDLKLNSTDKLVMGLIMSLTSKRNECTASNGFLAHQLQVSKRTITKSLTILKKNNLISIKSENYQRKIYSNVVWIDNSMGYRPRVLYPIV